MAVFGLAAAQDPPLNLDDLKSRASAGDIGPEFLRNYRFTIDPFGKALILEKPLASSTRE